MHCNIYGKHIYCALYMWCGTHMHNAHVYMCVLWCDFFAYIFVVYVYMYIV